MRYARHTSVTYTSVTFLYTRVNVSSTSIVANISFVAYLRHMITYTLDISPERMKDAEKALTALLPLLRKRSKVVHVQAAGNATPIAVPREALAIMIEVLRQMSNGGASALVPMDEELTTQQAADMLHVSRPFVIGLLDSGVIPSRKVGKHRRVKALDLVMYKQADELTRKTRLDELTAEAQRLGLGY